jgi:hypothetical protein
MIRCTSQNLRGLLCQPLRGAVFKQRFSVVRSDYDVFPRQTEGNEYATNFSLANDGVVPVGDAFRNARTALLSSRLPSKPINGVVDVKTMGLVGEFTMKEAGDTMSFGDFEDFFTASQQYLSSGSDLFIEDAAVGTQANTRVGVRIVSDNAAVCVAARSLLVPIPPRECDHRARYNGWNLDERWDIANVDMQWTGNSYENVALPGRKQKGQRPITVFIGALGSEKSTTSAIQFVSANDGEIVGANIVTALGAPLLAAVSGIATAAVTLVNESKDANALAVPGLTVMSGGKAKLIVCPEETPFAQIQAAVEKAISSNILYSGYGSIITSDGVGALFGGAIGASGTPSTSALTVSVGDKSVVAINPDNLVALPTEVVIVGAAANDVEAKLVEICGEHKQELIGAMLKGATVSTAKDVLSAI